MRVHRKNWILWIPKLGNNLKKYISTICSAVFFVALHPTTTHSVHTSVFLSPMVQNSQGGRKKREIHINTLLQKEEWNTVCLG